ncbi:MAG: NAD+ synthase [Actinomycetota bacterium]|nr:NAD+ synthase [Actinomycetota bacterium]
MIRIALGQLNTTVGDLDGNVARMAEWAARATEAGADVVCFPELAVTGYPPEDLVLRPEFVRDNLLALDELAGATASGCQVIVGFVDRSDRGIHNASAWLRSGQIVARYHKIQLPNYGVFDERRYFVPGTATCRRELAGETLAMSVCEDAWHPGMPFSEYTGVRAVANINGSPYHQRKTGERADVLRDRARETGAWIVYVNAVGGQDELVFDGGSMVVAPDGSVACRAATFEEDMLLVEIDADGCRAEERPAWPRGPEEVYRALVLGTGDYVRKNGFDGVVIGLSGGVDSALVATLATDALGAGAVHVLAMPSPYSSPESLEDAVDCATRLGVRIDEIEITDIFDAYRKTLSNAFAGTEEGLAEENLQARIRGNLLMAMSNKFGGLVLATGNKSEYAVGYSTLYGDMAGGFAPIKDLPKTLVYEVCAWRNAQTPERPPIPERVLTKPPSAELRPGQLDTDSLPPYESLDPIIEAYVEDDLGPDEIVARGHDADVVRRVVRMIDRAEYKRRQAAPGVKITPKAFGRDRRMPITNRYPGSGPSIGGAGGVP